MMGLATEEHSFLCIESILGLRAVTISQFLIFIIDDVNYENSYMWILLLMRLQPVENTASG